MHELLPCKDWLLLSQGVGKGRGQRQSTIWPPSFSIPPIPLEHPLHGSICLFRLQGEGLHQLREALKILAERVLILETMIGLHGE